MIPVGETSNPNDITFRVVVNATAAASATQMVNLTVKHINNQTIVWQSNKLSAFERGQTLICEVSTNEEISDFEIIDSPFVTKKTILGLTLKWFIVTIVSSTTLFLLIVLSIIISVNKKKNKKFKNKKSVKK